MLLRQLLDPETSTWTYLLADPASGEAVLVDPVAEQQERDTTLLRELGLRLRAISPRLGAGHSVGGWMGCRCFSDSCDPASGNPERGARVSERGDLSRGWKAGLCTSAARDLKASALSWGVRSAALRARPERTLGILRLSATIRSVWVLLATKRPLLRPRYGNVVRLARRPRPVECQAMQNPESPRGSTEETMHRGRG